MPEVNPRAPDPHHTPSDPRQAETSPPNSGEPEHAQDRRSGPRRKKRSGPIRVLPPDVIAISDEDYEQAVTALATMIAAWWHEHQHDPDL